MKSLKIKVIAIVVSIILALGGITYAGVKIVGERMKPTFETTEEMAEYIVNNGWIERMELKTLHYLTGEVAETYTEYDILFEGQKYRISYGSDGELWDFYNLF